MIKFDEKGEITKEWKEYISNLSREDLETFAIGADAYAEELEKNITDAIEYIKDEAHYNCWLDIYKMNELVGILKGEDNE